MSGRRRNIIRAAGTIWVTSLAGCTGHTDFPWDRDAIDIQIFNDNGVRHTFLVSVSDGNQSAFKESITVNSHQNHIVENAIPNPDISRPYSVSVVVDQIVEITKTVQFPEEDATLGIGYDGQDFSISAYGEV